MRFPRMRTLCAMLACAFVLFALPAYADESPHDRGEISGTVVDAQSGVAVSGATVALTGDRHASTTDARGAFAFTSLHPGTYQLEVAHAGYQPAVSTPVAVAAGQNVRTTLSIERASSNLHVIATSATRSATSLQQSSTQTQTLDAEALQLSGVVRAGDALRTLPGVNNGINGDTAALGDDINLNVRGIGQPETIAAIDGHPIGYGIKGGYNYQLSPIFPYRDVQVLYGSGGSNILGVNAIGGVVNFQTLDATPADHVTATQGFGSFQKLASSVTATGASGRLGYAAAYGTSGLDGPFRNASFYQTGAAVDPSAPVGSATYDRAIYPDDSSATSRADLIKLNYRFDSATDVTLTNVNSSYWENKTGNGDGDYLPYATALARGNSNLTAYDKETAPSVVCGSGQFYVSGNKYGVNGQTPGCQTPAQYASLQTGWQGAGPAWQSFNFGYQDLDVRHRAGNGTISLDTFTTLYNDDQFRENLPYKTAFDDTEKTTFSQVDSTGAILSDDFVATNNDVQFGYSYLNNAYIYRTIKYAGTTQTYPVTDETAYFLRDVFHPERSPLTAFLNLWAKHASATDSSYVDPRLSILDRITPRDVVRVAYGATTTEPTSDELNQPFNPSALADGTLQGAGGGTSYVCNGLNSLGTAPSSVLKPERGVDEEASYGHTWFGDTITQLELYNVDVYDKLYSTIVPISQTGTGFLSAGQLAAANTALTTVCGAGNYTLGVSGTVNVGTLRARGGDLQGRLRFNRRLYADYDWALTSSVLANAPAALLQSNLTDIVGSQIKGVPLHTANVALDGTVGVVDARYTLYTVSVNNTKNLPAYNYSDLQFSVPLAQGRFTVAISNLFNQYANIAGLIGEGVAAPLNQYATASSYSPLIGTAATEQYGLPYRSIYFSYQFRH
jgi:hypothetical protein